MMYTVVAAGTNFAQLNTESDGHVLKATSRNGANGVILMVMDNYYRPGK